MSLHQWKLLKNNAYQGGQQIRTIDKGGIQTQVVTLDLGGAR